VQGNYTSPVRHGRPTPRLRQVMRASAVLFLSISTGFGQCVTNVPAGTVSGTWTRAGSPYCITGNVQVGSLTIQPGVRVEFQGSFAFAVPGLLTAVGTAQAPIVFAKATSTSGWQGVAFSFSRGGSELVYVNISGSVNGGLRIENTVTPPVIRNCVISNNSRPDSGGGVFIRASGKVTLTGCMIDANTASNGTGGFTYGGGIYTEGELRLEQVTISNNRNHLGGSTGGTKYARGGGIYTQGKLELVRSTVHSNVITTEGFNSGLIGQGAGLYIKGDASIINSLIVSNQANATYSPTGFGGGSANQGAGIFVESGSSRVDITNSTIYRNNARAAGGGGGVYTQSSTTTTVLNSVIWENTSIHPTGATLDDQIVAGGTVVASYSDIKGGGIAGVGNINLDPIFDDSFLHLSRGSPAIDAGTCIGAPSDDIDGDPRPAGAGCDIGADEFTPKLPKIESILGSASASATGSPGSWFSVYGAGFADTTRSWQMGDFSGSQLPVRLEGTEVRLNGRPIPLSFVSPSQINAVLPWGTPLGPVSITISTDNGVSPPVLFTVQSLVPGFFTFEPANRRYPAAVHVNGDLAGPIGLFGSGLVTRPARPGDVILLYASGLGPTSPSAPEGVLIQNPLELVNAQSLVLRIGGIAAHVSFAGLVGVGLYQINATIPTLAPGDHPIVVELSRVASQSGTFLSVEQRVTSATGSRDVKSDSNANE
jgi:uncharacterized protein (TIGR03437 family)